MCHLVLVRNLSRLLSGGLPQLPGAELIASARSTGSAGIEPRTVTANGRRDCERLAHHWGAPSVRGLTSHRLLPASLSTRELQFSRRFWSACAYTYPTHHCSLRRSGEVIRKPSAHDLSHGDSICRREAWSFACAALKAREEPLFLFDLRCFIWNGGPKGAANVSSACRP